MSHNNLLCRLCLTVCKDCKNLYGDSGQSNETYDVAVKYFHPMFLAVDQDNNQNTVICLKCWHHISEFHTYQQAVFKAQKNLLAGEAHVELPTNSSLCSVSMDVCVKTEGEEDLISLPDLELMDEYCYEDLIPKEDSKELSVKETACKGSANNKKKNDDKIRNGVHNELHEPDWSSITVEKQEPEDFNYNDMANSYYTSGNQAENQESDDFTNEYIAKSYNTSGKQAEMTLQRKLNTSISYNNRSINADDNSPSNGSQTKRSKKSIVEIDFSIAKWRSQLDCELCGSKFSCFGVLQDHFRTDHPSEECFIVCCNRKFNSRSKIEGHARFHIDPDAFRCDKCQCLMSSEASLYTHSRRCQPERFTNIHKKTPLDEIDHFISMYMPSLTCELCHESYARFTLLKTHFKQAHPGKEFHVMCCQKKFMGRSQYKEHIWLHMDQNAFRCKLCGKFHSRYISLQVHMERHHGTQLKPLRPHEIIKDLKLSRKVSIKVE